MSTMQALPENHPEMKAWEKYKESEEYKNSFKWAEQERHREGSMWAAFDAGWRFAHSQWLEGVELKAPKE